MSLDTTFQKIWYGPPGIVSTLLLPLAGLFGAIAAARRWAFRKGLIRTTRLARPVVVVGNITVGGTGKTPLVIWLAKALTRQGLRVGIITRGYGGAAERWPQAVHADSDPVQVGDEAVLLALETAAIVMAGPDRIVAAEHAIAAGAEVILSDDGLQHYRLERDCELAVVDSRRLLGNGRLLPAGPLRELPERLRQVDLILINRRGAVLPSLPFSVLPFDIQLQGLRNLATGELRDLETFANTQVHVVTGIGHPQAFIEALQARRIRPDTRILSDHARFTRSQIEFGDDLPVLMTGKDAVKCRRFADQRHWAVEAEVVLDAEAQQRLLACVRRACER